MYLCYLSTYDITISHILELRAIALRLLRISGAKYAVSSCREQIGLCTDPGPRNPESWVTLVATEEKSAQLLLPEILGAQGPTFTGFSFGLGGPIGELINIPRQDISICQVGPRPKNYSESILRLVCRPDFALHIARMVIAAPKINYNILAFMSVICFMFWQMFWSVPLCTSDNPSRMYVVTRPFPLWLGLALSMEVGSAFDQLCRS